MKAFTFLQVALALVTAGVNAAPAATSTPVGVAGPAPTASCGNQGLQYAYYTDNFDFYNASYYAKYDPTVLKRSKAIRQVGNTTYVYYSYNQASNPPTQPPYPYSNDTALPGRYFALNHRGYLYANTTGSYTFSSASVDDIEFVWVGQQAYSGWNRSNANNIVTFDSTNYFPGSGSYSAQLVAGHYYPIRIIFKQGDGNAALNFQIIDPKGKLLLAAYDNTTLPTLDVMQYSCNGRTAPRYPAFGQES